MAFRLLIYNPLTYFPQYRLPQLSLIVREWRHVKMLKRAGAGHGLINVNDTPRGSLAVPCRACPHPNINLLQGWEDAPEDMK